jgi:hypothetical protein
MHDLLFTVWLIMLLALCWYLGFDLGRRIK